MMKSVLKIRDFTFNFDGEAFAPSALAFYEGLADLLGDHKSVKVAIEHGGNGDRVVTRMVLTPSDLRFDVTGGPVPLIANASVLEGLKSSHAEKGFVLIPDFREIAAALSDGRSDAEA